MSYIRIRNSSRPSTKLVLLVGHSLGGAISILEGLYLRMNLPPTINVNIITFGQPRVSREVYLEERVFTDLICD